MSFSAIEGRKVSFSYDRKGKFKTLNGLDISVPTGSVYALLGPSGCGKTTLLRCIVGYLKPKSGSIKVYGRTPGESGFCIPGHGVGYMPQELALYLDISIEELLTYFGRLFHMHSSQIAERITFLIKLLKIPHKCSIIKNLSGGQKRRVSFAAALIHKPPLLILDEPTVGVDPLLRHSIWDHLKELALTDHSTIIITTHYIEEARMADVVGLMRDGHLLAEKNPEILIEQYFVHTLEEVFLKLCREDFETNAESATFESLMLTSDKADNDRDVWVSQEAWEEKKENGFVNGKNGCNYISSSDTSHLYQIETISKLHDHDDPRMEVIYCKTSSYDMFFYTYRRMVALIIKSFIQMRRSWPVVLFQLFVPAFQILAFCLFIGRTPNNLPLAIVNLETSPFGFSQSFLNEINSDIIEQVPFSNLTTGIESVETGKSWGVLYIGPYFSTAMMDRFLEGSNVDNETIEKSVIKVRLDMTNQQIYMTIYATINQAFQSFGITMLESTYQNPRLAEAPILLGEPIYGKQDTNFTEFMASGMMLSVTHFMAMGLTALSIVLEKKDGLLDRSWVAGVNSAEVIFSILFSMSVTMAFQVIFVLVIVLGVFAIPVKGSLLAAFFCVFLGGLNGMVTGLFISSLSYNENQAVMLVLGLFSPTFLLSGIIWPVEAMSYYWRWISYSLPLTLLADTLRSVLLRGWSLVEYNIWDGIVVSSSWNVLLTLLAIVIFKYSN